MEPFSTQLKEAAVGRNMGAWTEALTNVVARTCAEMGWTCCAKWNKNPALPEGRNEYLTLDVTVFPQDRTGWQIPLGAIELENNAKKRRIAYCLWKLLSVAGKFRCLFCYREREEAERALLRYLCDDVVAALTAEERAGIDGPTLVCVGTRDVADRFPYGFFRWWRLNFNTCAFERL